MKNIRFENYEIFLKEQLKNKRFRQLYEMECIKVTMAQRLIELREGEKLTKAQVAKKSGVSQQFISQLESGEGKNLTLETLVRLAGALGRGVRISFPKISARGEHFQVA